MTNWGLISYRCDFLHRLFACLSFLGRKKTFYWLLGECKGNHLIIDNGTIDVLEAPSSFERQFFIERSFT